VRFDAFATRPPVTPIRGRACSGRNPAPPDEDPSGLRHQGPTEVRSRDRLRVRLDVRPAGDALPGAEEPIDLRGFLLEAGVSPAEIEQAGTAGTLELLALEKIVAVDEPRYELDEVAALSGVAADRIRAYWRALGFPDPRSGEKLFSDSDL
jgi:hypothetical protein